MAKPVTVTKERILSAASARALTAAPTPSFLHSAPSRESGTPMHALMEQNQLQQELRACPRYIQDEEWAELERMLRNFFNQSYKCGNMPHRRPIRRHPTRDTASVAHGSITHTWPISRPASNAFCKSSSQCSSRHLRLAGSENAASSKRS